jgi:hypothetical protein
VTPVGLFVNAAGRASMRATRASRIWLLQFHGDEIAGRVPRRRRAYLRRRRMAPGFDLLDFALRIRRPGPPARRARRGLRRRRKGLRLVTHSTKRAPSSRFVWWVACRKCDRSDSSGPALGR